MNLSRQQLIDRLDAAGVPTFGAHLNGDVFGTVEKATVSEIARATMAELAANAPELVEQRHIGGGKSVPVPRYVLKGFNCRGHHLKLYAHLMTGFAIKGAKAALAGTPLDHDALAAGFLEYTAEPRADNLGRAGRHQQFWHIDENGDFQTFEFGDGEENEFTPSELASVTFFYGQ